MVVRHPHLRRVISLSVLALGLFTACAQDDSGTSSESPRTAAPAATTSAAKSLPTAQGPAIDFETCGGFGVSEAAALLAIPAVEIDDRSGVQDWGKDCTFVRQGDVLYEKAVSFTLSRASSAGAAAEEYAQLRGHAGIVDEVMPGAGGSHLVPDLGDEALWVSANDSLYVRKGAVKILVTMPGDEESQIRVARALLE